ncbi:MAG: hypothetical protein AB8E82_07805 [Aureispira sp.]
MTGAYQFLKKYGVAIGFGIGAILAVLTFVIIAASYPDIDPSKEELYEMSSFNFGIYATYVLIGLACSLVLVFTVAYVVRNPKESLKGIVAFAILLALLGITYSMGDAYLTEELINSDNTLLPVEEKVVDGNTITVPVIFKEGETQSSSLQLADGLIKYGYIMLILAVIAMGVGMLRDLIKQ